MAESTITAKGQTTVPAEIRALVDAGPGTRLVWSATPDGTIIVRAKSRSIFDMAGMHATRRQLSRLGLFNEDDGLDEDDAAMAPGKEGA